MKSFKTIIILTLVVALLFIGVFWYGRQIGRQAAAPGEKPPAVSSQLILDRITSQYFLVTKTVFVNSQAEIETPEREGWTGLFTGKKITLRGLVRVDVGVDMKNLTTADIAVDSNKKTVTISLPAAAVLDSSLYGELDIAEDKAIVETIKSWFKDTRNEDYNRVLETLLTEAEGQVAADSRILSEARADSISLVELIVAGLAKDYRVIVE